MKLMKLINLFQQHWEKTHHKDHDDSGWDVSRYRTYRFSPACHVLSFFPQSRKQEESFILWRTGVHLGKEF